MSNGVSLGVGGGGSGAGMSCPGCSFCVAIPQVCKQGYPYEEQMLVFQHKCNTGLHIYNVEKCVQCYKIT